jgi:hypothetical protein
MVASPAMLPKAHTACSRTLSCGLCSSLIKALFETRQREFVKKLPDRAGFNDRLGMGRCARRNIGQCPGRLELSHVRLVNSSTHLDGRIGTFQKLNQSLHNSWNLENVINRLIAFCKRSSTRLDFHLPTDSCFRSVVTACS